VLDETVVRKNCPKIPALNATVHPGDVSSDARRILNFMSETGRDVLAGCKHWYVDRKYKFVSGTFFCQILMVIGLSETGIIKLTGIGLARLRGPFYALIELVTHCYLTRSKFNSSVLASEEEGSPLLLSLS
jgi:hypothetical protein